MKQPELGLRVAELRQQNGLTQEQLAEKCQVTPRTIQRIESGAVSPRLYTLNCLSENLDFDFGEDDDQHEEFWLVALHLSSMFAIFIIPLLIWSWKKRQSCEIDRHGRDVLNFQITITMMLFVALILLFVLTSVATLILIQTNEELLAVSATLYLCSLAPFIIIGIFTTFQGVINAGRVLADKPYHYPLSIPFIK